MNHTIEDFKLQTLENAQFVKTSLATYKQNGKEKFWEIVESHDSVAILLYHKEREAFILVQQFRPPVFIHNGDGITIELCAGIIDKKLSLVQIAQEEIEEECGFLVPLNSIERITKVHSSVGTAGTTQTIFYAEVDESLRVSEGGGINDEFIEVLTLPVSDAKVFMFDESKAKTTGLLFALMWWFNKFNY